MIDTDDSGNVGSTSSAALGEIAASVRGLVLPSPALYHTCHQERLREHWERLAALDARLEDLHRQGFSAATRLLSLDPPPQGSGDPETSPAGVAV